eukprot:CCRYP_008066-RA/>CCRYP_008066-RA protein AED:0.04 eAED:0.04 QI:88/1/1/1/1/1/2/279/247
MSTEATPLLQKSNPSTSPPSTAYFLDGVHRRNGSSASAVSSQHSQPAPWLGAEIINPMPEGAEKDEFAPRPVAGRAVAPAVASRHMKAPSIGGDWLSYIALKGRPSSGPFVPTAENKAAETGDVGTLLIPRKVPVKVEPKVHMANERTFLTWLHLVATLAAASMTIIKFARDESAVNIIFGLVLLPASLAFLVYALFQYMRRAYMIKEHLPGPYIDIAGPTTLTVILIGSIIAEFGARLYHDINQYE